MAITRPKKEEILQGLVDKFGKSKSVVFAANHGLSVDEMAELREKLRENGIDFQIAKKTLFQLACEKNDISGVNKEVLDGSVGAAFSYEDMVTAPKLLAAFAKEHDKLTLVAGIMEGKLIAKDMVIELSTLPTKDELIAKFMGSMTAPLSGFVGIGNNLIGGFVRALNAVREQKEAA